MKEWGCPTACLEDVSCSCYSKVFACRHRVPEPGHMSVVMAGIRSGGIIRIHPLPGRRFSDMCLRRKLKAVRVTAAIGPIGVSRLRSAKLRRVLVRLGRGRTYLVNRRRQTVLASWGFRTCRRRFMAPPVSLCVRVCHLASAENQQPERLCILDLPPIMSEEKVRIASASLVSSQSVIFLSPW